MAVAAPIVLAGAALGAAGQVFSAVQASKTAAAQAEVALIQGEQEAKLALALAEEEARQFEQAAQQAESEARTLEEQARQDQINSVIGETRAFQADTELREELLNAIGTIRASRALGPDDALSPTAQAFQTQAETEIGRRRRIEVENERRRAADFRTAARQRRAQARVTVQSSKSFTKSAYNARLTGATRAEAARTTAANNASMYRSSGKASLITGFVGATGTLFKGFMASGTSFSGVTG